jgi:tetratricopeptide (TPR) repeat protein
MQLKFFYQVWGPPRIISTTPGELLNVKYAYGRPGGRMEAEFKEETVDRSQFDAHGSLVNGKEMELGSWAPGNYKLILTLTDPQTKQDSFSTLDFRLGQGFAPPNPWGIDDREETAKDVLSGERDYERGMSYLASGKTEEAGASFRRALEKNPNLDLALTALVDVDFSRKAYADVAKYASRVQLTDHTEERTILQLAQSLDKTGDTKDAIGLLESSLKTRKPTGTVYLTLAEYYGRQGSTEKASQYQKRGRELMAATSEKN